MVIVDNTPPEVDVKQPSGADKIFGEGAKTVLTVRQSGSKEDEWVAEFTDAGGKVVRSYHMKDSEPLTLEWNGTNETGAPLPDGVYNYRIAATDRAGNKSAPAGISNLIYSAEKPATNIVINGSRYFSPVGTGSKSVLFDVKIPLPDPKSGNKLTNWAVTIVSTDGKECKQFSGTDNPPSRIEFDGTDNNGKLINDGSYQAVVTAKYLNGYEPDVVRSPVFVLDTSVPVATVKTKGSVFSPDGDGAQDAMEIDQTVVTNKSAPVSILSGHEQGRYHADDQRGCIQSCWRTEHNPLYSGYEVNYHNQSLRAFCERQQRKGSLSQGRRRISPRKLHMEWSCKRQHPLR